MRKIFHLILLTFIQPCLGVSEIKETITNIKSVTIINEFPIPHWTYNSNFFFASDPTKTLIGGTPILLSADGISVANAIVTVKDNLGNDVGTGGEIVTLTTTMGTLSSVIDNGDGTYSATLTSTTSGFAIIFGTLNGVPITDNHIVQFTPGPASPSKSTITASPPSLEANGVDNSNITVQLKDANGNKITTGGDVVSLTTTLGLISTIIDNGNGTYSATINSTVSGFATITGKLNGIDITDNEFVQFNPGSPSVTESTIGSNPDSIVVNGVVTSHIFVQLKDDRKNNLTTGGETVTLQTTSGSLSSVTDHGDGSYSAKLTSSTSTGFAIVSGKLNGVDIVDDTKVTFIPGPAHSSKTVINSSPKNIIANGTSTSTITVQVKDFFGNNLISGGDLVALSTNKGTLSSITDNEDGTYTAILTSITSTDTANITGILNGAPIQDEEIVYFQPGPGDITKSTISVSKDSLVSNGSNTSLITVQLIDINGNFLNKGGETITLNTNLGSISSITDNGDGTYDATFTTGTTSGIALITGKLNGVDLIDNKTITLLPGPSDPTTSIITASPTTIIADGIAQSNLLIKLKDSNGNDITTGGETVVLNTTLGTLSSITDNNNGTYNATLTSSTITGTANISGKLNGVDILDNEFVTFVPGIANSSTSTISSNPDTIEANGVSTSTITVQLKDILGNNLNKGGDVVVLSTTKGFISPITDNNNGTYTATLTSSTISGWSVISGTLNGDDFQNIDSVLFAPGSPDPSKSIVESTQDSIIADGNSFTTITIKLIDQFGNDIKTGGENVIPSTTLGTLGPTTDNNDGTYTTILTSIKTVGQAIVTTTLNGTKIPAEKTIYFVPGPADINQSKITSNPSNILANGTDIANLLITLFDKDGNRITKGGDIVSLSSTIGNLNPVVDNEDGSYSSSISSLKAGFAVINATLNGSNILDNEVIQINPGSASTTKSTISSEKDTIIADGTSTSIITIQLKDIHENNLTSGGHVISLTTTHGNLSGIIDNNNGSYTCILSSVTNPGLAIISGKLNSQPFSQKDSTIMVPGDPDVNTISITIDKDTILADGLSNSAVTVQLKDKFGNNINQGGEIIELETNLGNISDIVDNENGTYSAKIISSKKSGLANVQGKFNGKLIISTDSIFFKPGTYDPSKILITASPNQIVADGLSSSTITILIRDRNENIVLNGGHNIQLNATKGTLTNLIDHDNGIYTCDLISTTIAQTSIISGELDGQSILNTAEVQFVPGAPDHLSSTITASPKKIIADGLSSSIITLQLKDQFSNNINIGGELIFFETTAGDISFATDNNNGTYTAELFSTSNLDTAIISANLGSNFIEDKDTVIFIAGIGDTKTSIIYANPDTIIANGISQSTITVELFDRNQNKITTGGENVFFTTDLGNISDVTDHNNGSYSAILTSTTEIGKAVIKAKLQGIDLDSSTNVVFDPDVASAEMTTIISSPKIIVANGVSKSTVEISLKDKFGNPVKSSNNILTISTSQGDLSLPTNNNDGTFTSELTSSALAGMAVITGNLNGVEILKKDSVEFIPGNASVKHTKISTSKKEIFADGTSNCIILVKVLDEFGNPLRIGGDTIFLNSSAGVLGNVKDLGNGSYEATLTASTVIESAIITGALNNINLLDSAVVDFIPFKADLLKSQIIASKNEIEANGTSTSLITVKLFDELNHPLTKGGDSITLSTNYGKLSNVVDNDDGTYTSILTSDTLANTAIIKGRLYKNLIEDNDSVKFIAGTPDNFRSTIESIKSEIIANGTDKTEIIVTLFDQFGNRIKIGGNDVKIETSLGTLNQVKDNNNGTYSADLTSGTKSGEAIVRATINGIEILELTKVKVNADKASILTSSISSSHSKLMADGKTNAQLTIVLSDQNNNPLEIGGDILTLQTNAGTIGELQDRNDGTYTATITSPTYTATSIIIGILNGVPMKDTATINFYEDLQPDLNKINLTASDTIIVADGISISTISLELIDQNGNTINQGGFNVELFTTAGNISPVTDHGAGIYTAILTSSFKVEVAKITGKIDGKNLIDNARVSFVLKEDIVKVPEGFSPNGDNVNDQFKILGIEKIPNNSLKIFNRWGNLVYSTKGYQNTWEGFASGGSIIGNEMLPAGTYFYILELGGEIQPKSGYFYLKR